MANVFPFAKSKSIQSGGSAVWTNQIVTQTESPLSFSSTEISLTESLNDSYATAAEENETQYLSVLESSHENTLEDIHDFTLSDQKLIIQDNIKLNNEADPENSLLTDSGEQVFIFNVEGSDELYGMQVAQDEDGNLHRYQFQFRKTEDGQLEANPETVQLLVNEEDQEATMEAENIESDLPENTDELVDNPDNEIIEEIFETEVYLQSDIEQSDDGAQLLLSKSEEISDEIEGVEDVYEEQEETMTEHILEDDYEVETIDIKPGVDDNLIDNFQEVCLDEGVQPELHGQLVESLSDDCASEAESCSTSEQNENDGTIIPYQQFDAHEMEDYEGTDSLESESNRACEEQFDQVYINEENVDELGYNEEETTEEVADILIVEKDTSAQDSDVEDYEVVDGLPVTADEDTNERTSTDYQKPEILVKDVSYKLLADEYSNEKTSPVYQKPEIFVTEPERFTEIAPVVEKTTQKTNILKPPSTNKSNDLKKKTILYYMVNPDQKENLNSLSNPRSLLKNNPETINSEEVQKRIQREKLMEKRYARSKEAIQAKLFNNFLNKTTIPHAPIRQTRLPRKQEIKPVDTRRNEEIIVKEVMVSSKGFVESVSDRLKSLDKLEISSVVELSDSDDDYDPKNGTKKKRKRKKNNKPVNSDSSQDSDVSVIEILQSDDESPLVESANLPEETIEVEETLKRSREKPSRSSDESSANKKSRTESSEPESDNGKKEITCPHCPKTFPSQNSLSTHIQHHNLENSLQNNKKLPVEYKYKCDKCPETFKNSILLTRHVCKINPSHHKCTVCGKVFKGIFLFNAHKRSHVKENLVKSTNSVTISPKKFLTAPSTSFFKVPSKPGPSFKCQQCSRVFSTQNLLLIHEKCHRKFVCDSCNVNFTSKLLLDTHRRMKCVKTASPKGRRLSFKIRRSYAPSPRRSSFLPRRSVAPRTSINLVNKNSKSNCTNQAKSNHIPRASITNQMNAKDQPTSSNASCLNVNQISNKPKSGSNATKINCGLNTSSMIRTLDVDAKCDSCPMKFRNLTSLFKHKVKNHGLSTPDKTVFDPEKKTIHKPLNVHGGIPANERLNKAFQLVRKKLISETDTD